MYNQSWAFAAQVVWLAHLHAGIVESAVDPVSHQDLPGCSRMTQKLYGGYAGLRSSG